MCGRFVTPDEAAIEAFWTIGRRNWRSLFAVLRQARFNVAPQQGNPENYVAVIRADPDGTLELTDMQWWLLPYWSKEARIKYSTFNARIENVVTSASFREPFKRRRCLVPAQGWFEWQDKPGGKQAWFFHAANESLLAFAGIWDRWRVDGQTIESFAIIVGAPDPTVEHVHDRVPCLIPAQNEAVWLDPRLTDAEEIKRLLVPACASAIAFHRVGRAVGNVRNQGSELIVREPLANESSTDCSAAP